MEKLRYALIGAGRIAPNHIKAFLDHTEELEMAALCDIDPKAAAELRARFPQALAQAPFYTSHKEMLEKERPELCAVATFSGTHAAIAVDCLEHGAHVIIEKPIALSIEDADRILAKAEEKRLMVCANHQNRFNKSIQKIREKLEEGAFGRMLHGAAHIRWARDENYYRAASWRGTWEQDGGALMNQCIHDIDLLRWMMGDEVDEVMAYTDNLKHPYVEAEDLGLALIKFKNGAYGLVEGTTNVYPNNLEETLYLFGEKGTAKAGGTSVNTIDEWRFDGCPEDAEEVKRACSENPENVYGFGHSIVYTDMIEAIRTGRKPYIDGYAGKRALELVLAIYQSAALGRPVKLPLQSCSTLDFAGRFGR